MTGKEGRTAPAGPPWSEDELADLHAGLFDDEVSARMWREASADPQARAVLEALEATTIDLAELPPIRMPDAVAGRLDQAIAAESAARTGQPVPAPVPAFAAPAESGNVVDFAAARRRRNSRIAVIAGTLTAAAAALAIGLTVLPGVQTGSQDGSTGDNVAQPAPPPGNPAPGPAEPPLALGNSDELNTGMAGRAMSAKDYGPMADVGKRNACLAANEAEPQRVVGARQVDMNGSRGVLFVLTTGERGQFRLLAVGADCGRDNPATLADKKVP